MASSNDATGFYKKLAITFAVGLVAIAVVFLGIVPLIQHLAKPAYLDILVLPESAKLQIDGVEYRNAVYEMEPGSYSATVEMEGASRLELNLDLAKNQTTGVYLAWSEESGEWRQYSSGEMAHRNSIGGIMPMYLSICGTPAARVNCDAIVVQFGRNAECDNELCLAISGRRSELTPEVTELVQNSLKEKGFDSKDYRYFYKQNDAR